MNPDSIRSVQDSWARIAPFSGAAAAIFFDRLVEQDPVFRRVFPDYRRGSDMAAFLRLMTVGVRSLGKLEEMIPAAEDLGRRAVMQGLGDAQYRSVAEALIWSIERVMGRELAPAARRAWGEAFLT